MCEKCIANKGKNMNVKELQHQVKTKRVVGIGSKSKELNLFHSPLSQYSISKSLLKTLHKWYISRPPNKWYQNSFRAFELKNNNYHLGTFHCQSTSIMSRNLLFFPFRTKIETFSWKFQRGKEKVSLSFFFSFLPYIMLVNQVIDSFCHWLQEATSFGAPFSVTDDDKTPLRFTDHSILSTY